MVGPKGNADALNNYETQANRRNAGRLIILEPQPLCPARFAREPGITVADSQEIFNAFQSYGWLDANDMLRQNPTTFNWRAALPTRFSTVVQSSIERQIDVTYTTHEFPAKPAR